MTTNTTRRTLRISFLSLMLALLALLFMSSSVSAQATVPHQGMGVAPGSDGLQTEIVGNPANFVPTHLSCKVGQMLTGSNDTAVAQTITFKGQPFITIAAKADATVTCPNMKGTFVFGLKSNPKAKLTVTVH